ncbi:MAG: AI-2E family transporter [Burkholderiaceae bacterium]
MSTDPVDELALPSPPRPPAPLQQAVDERADGREPPAPASAGFRPRRLDPWLRLCLIVISVVTAAAAIRFAKALLLPIVLAVLLTLLLTPVVNLLDRARLPRWLGALVVVAALISALVFAAGQLAAPSEQWLNPRSPEWSKLESRLRELKRPFERLQGAQKRMATITEAPGRPPPREVVIERSSLMGVVTDTQVVVVGALSTIVLLYFLLASGDLFLRKLVRVLPSLADRKTAVGIARTIQTEIGRYFATITMINLGLGLVTALIMGLIGMPSPWLWGALVAVLNFVPYVGPGTSLVILTAAAVVSLDNWSQIVAVPLAFFTLTLIEGQLLQPALVGRRLRLNVVVTFLSVLIWGWLWGLGGVFVAVPMLVVLRICADHIEALSAAGEFVSSE